MQPEGAICMAVYRPDLATLAMQIESLQAQTVRAWTCQIAIDGGTADDLAIVTACIGGDDRFHVVNYPDRVGFYRNFERALRQVDDAVTWIALCDQDDLWYPHKLERLLPVLERAALVSGQARVVRRVNGQTIDEGVTTRRWNGLFADQLDNVVTGSFSILRASVARAALPFPAATDAAYHDHWIGVCAAALGGVEIVDEPLQDYMQHGQNVLGESQGGGWLTRLRSWRTKAGGFSVGYLADQRWGWRVTMARTLPDRVPSVPASVSAAIEPIWQGRFSFTLLRRSLVSVARRQAPAGRVLALLTGAIATPLRRGAPWPASDDEGEREMLDQQRMVPARTVAFYLPQFHSIPENDAWWGEGFTEWTNVRRAQSAFDGHDHPRKAGTLGEYNLRDASVLHSQAELAAANGVDAFCIYYYWFSGKRLLESPLDTYLAQGPDFPFCISWANENWSRRWDGKDHEVLIAQDYDESTAAEVFADMARYLGDPRYLRVEGRPVIVVHRVDHIPDVRRFADTWRRMAREAGLGELHLVAAETRRHLDPRAAGFDAVAEFPPVGANTLGSALLVPPRGLDRAFRGRLMSYGRTAKRAMRRKTPKFRRHPGVMPSWDNTARRGMKGTVYVGATPELYGQWLAEARRREEEQDDARLVFVNAWNEWAEGAYLEPDATHGTAYLEATRPDWTSTGSAARTRMGIPSFGWVRSLALSAAATGLNSVRWVHDRIRRGDAD